jgi:hypothetical protein
MKLVDSKKLKKTPLSNARQNGDATHGHGPLAIAPGERILLSAWLKQGRDWLMLQLQGRADLINPVDFLSKV